MTWLLALLALLTFVDYLSVFIALHIALPSYNPLRRTVSDYANSKFGRVYTLSLWGMSLGILALAFALKMKLGLATMTTRAFVYLLLAVFSRAFVAYFPTDPAGKPKTRRGRLHYISAIAAFAFTFMSISVLTPALGAQPAWHALRSTLLWLARLAEGGLIAIVAAMVIKPLRRSIFGLCERIFLSSADVWFALIAFALLFRP